MAFDIRLLLSLSSLGLIFLVMGLFFSGVVIAVERGVAQAQPRLDLTSWRGESQLIMGEASPQGYRNGREGEQQEARQQQQEQQRHQHHYRQKSGTASATGSKNRHQYQYREQRTQPHYSGPAEGRSSGGGRR